MNARLKIETQHEFVWDLLVTSNEQSDNPLARFLFDRSGSPVRWLREATAEPSAQSRRVLGRLPASSVNHRARSVDKNLG